MKTRIVGSAQSSSPLAVDTRVAASVTGTSVPQIIASLCAGLAVLAGSVLLPVQSRIWNGSGGPSAATLLSQVLAPHLTETVAASTLGQPPLAYFQAGHLFLLVYVGLLLAVVVSPTIPQTRLKTALLSTLGVGAVADTVVYWWGEFLVKSAREFVFWYVEVPSLVGTVLLTTAVAAQMRKASRRPRLAKVLPFSVVPAAVLLTAVFEYIPHGPMLAVAIVLWLLIRQQPINPSPLNHWQRGIPIGTGVLLGSMVLLTGVFRYQPRLVSGPVISAIAPIHYQTRTGLKLHVFNTGYNRMSRALAPGNPVWRPSPAFVIEHPTKGLVVFDAGLSSAVAQHGEAALPFPMSVLFESRGEPDQTLDAQMKRSGLDPARVKLVMLSHLHEDHLGNLNAFPRAQILLSEKADTAHLPFRGLSVRLAERLAAKPSSLGALYDVLGDSTIRLVSGGGHSPEDLMAWVNLETGPVLLAGDAVVHWEWLEAEDVERVSANGDRAAQVRNQLRALLARQPELVLFPGHDTSRIPRHRNDIIVHEPNRFHPNAWASRLSLPR